MCEFEFILAVKARCLLTFGEGSLHTWQSQEHRKRSVGNTLWSTWSMDLYNYRPIHNNPCAWFVRKTFLMKQWSRLGSSNIQKIHPDKSGKTLAFFHSLRDQFLKRKTRNMFTSSSNQHIGANQSRRGTCKLAKWRGSETKVQNLLPSLLDANSDPKTLPNPVERHQVIFHCFSDFLPGWEAIQRRVQAPYQTKKQTHRNRAWWSETAPDKPSSWCWQFDCNAPSPLISLSRVVVNDYSFSFTIYFMFNSRFLWLKNKC